MDTRGLVEMDFVEEGRESAHSEVGGRHHLQRGAQRAGCASRRRMGAREPMGPVALVGVKCEVTRRAGQSDSNMAWPLVPGTLTSAQVLRLGTRRTRKTEPALRCARAL